jgi:hypothetical protein
MGIITTPQVLREEQLKIYSLYGKFSSRNESVFEN